MKEVVNLKTAIKPMTNADKIRQMTDEELAEYLCDRTSECYHCEGCGKCHYDKEKEMMTGMIDWLKQEVESDG
jgi:uncharacterized cysteine cluster protein YcgN (CxxCxxCC family)